MDRVMDKNISFEHMVYFEEDNSILAAGREQNTGRLYLYLVFEDDIFSRNGRISSWEPLGRDELETIVNGICRAVNGGVRIFRLKSSCAITAGAHS